MTTSNDSPVVPSDRRTRGPKRWREQAWLTEHTVETLGIEFDQPRLGYYLGPVRDDQAFFEVFRLRQQVKKLSDLTDIGAVMAMRREGLARQAEGAGRLVTASTHWYAATQLWGLATYPVWENTADLLKMHERKATAYRRWGQLVDHHVETVEIRFGDATLPAYLHLPSDFDGTPVPLVIASDGMDAGREFVVAQAGDEHLRRGLAVLAIDGPGQSEAATRGIYTSPEAWARLADVLADWVAARPEVDAARVALSGVSFGSYFMTHVAASRPDAFVGCAVQLPVFEPGCHTIFEVAGPAYKARHMWMAGLSDDEAAFDAMVAGYDLTVDMPQLTIPWFVISGTADELSPVEWVRYLADLSPGPVSTLLYDGARHALTSSTATALGPPWRTESIDWLWEVLGGNDQPVPHRQHRRVLRTGEVIEG